MKTTYSKIFNIAIIFIAILYFLLLFLNIDLFKVPNGDVYQYINDAENYAQLRFPKLIQVQPLMPLFMAIFRPFFSNFEFPYFATAKFLNILAATGSLFITYKLLNRHLKSWIAIIFAILCAIHPLSIVVSLDITTVGLYSFFALAAIYFIDGNKKLFFLMSSLAFLIRVEGIILFIVYLLHHFNLEKLKKTKAKIAIKEQLRIHSSLFFSICFVLFWIIFQTLHNIKNDTPYGNYYLFELSKKSFDKENLIYIFGLIEALLFPKNLWSWNLNLLNTSYLSIFLMFLSTFFIIQLLILNKTRVYGLYVLLMAILHSCFPAIENRYFYLFLHSFFIGIIIFFYDKYKKRKNKNLKKIINFSIILAIIWFVISKISNYQEEFVSYKNNDLEIIYKTSRWLFESLNDGEYFIIAKEPFLYYELFSNSKNYLQQSDSQKLIKTQFDNGFINFISDKKTINFVDLAIIKTKCQNSTCLLEKINKKNTQYIIISDWLTENYNKNFWIEKNGIFLIRDLLSKEKCLRELTILKDKYSYKKIISLDIDCYQDFDK